MGDNFLELSSCSSSSNFLGDPSFSTKIFLYCFSRNVGYFDKFYFLSATKDKVNNDDMGHLEVDLPATGASEEEVERNNVEEDVAGDKVERGVKSVKPIGAEIWAGKVLELVLEVASRQIRLAPAWVWHELCKIFDIPLQPGNSTFLEIIGKNGCQIICLNASSSTNYQI